MRNLMLLAILGVLGIVGIQYRRAKAIEVRIGYSAHPLRKGSSRRARIGFSQGKWSLSAVRIAGGEMESLGEPASSCC
jgi:hypothetical protein